MAPKDRALSDVELERRLEQTDSQLALYARDLRSVVDAEREKSRQLAVANARLERLNRLKSDFLTFISHELRTPLNAISAVDMFEDGAEEQTELIGLVRHGYDRLQGFIEKGLEYFYWLAMERPPSPETVDLCTIVNQVISARRDLSGESVNVQMHGSEGSLSVSGDPSALARVIGILLDNALKFSQPGDVFVTVFLERAASKTSLIVSDRGRGFPPELAGEIFEPFTVLDMNHHSQGTGLSLATASAIAVAHGGRLRAESPGAGKGAAFTFELPVVCGGNESV